MADWSELPYDVCSVISDKLSVPGDIIRFRSVCRTWRSAVSFPQPPWLMLAQDDSNPSSRGFVGLGRRQGGDRSGGGTDYDEDQQQEVRHFELPEASHTRSLGSTGSWLIAVDGKGRIFLLNPFSRHQIYLPPQSTFEHGLLCDDDELTPELLDRVCVIKKVVLSSSSSSSTNNCTAMAIHSHHYKLAMARPGDPSWTIVETPGDYFDDVIFYRGQFHTVNFQGVLMVCDIGCRPPKATPLNDIFKTMFPTHVNYLVEWIGELLYVVKYMDDDNDNATYQFNTFEVYSFDFAANKWNDFKKNLGDYSLFLGFNTSVALPTSRYPGLKSNCIYFTDDYEPGYRGFGIPGCCEMAIFDMEDGSVRPHYEGISTSLYSPPIWIIPPNPSSTNPGASDISSTTRRKMFTSLRFPALKYSLWFIMLFLLYINYFF